MWVTPGAAAGPGSGPALQAAVRKLQGLQTDLAQLLRLRKREAEYQARPLPCQLCASAAGLIDRC
jgi:hypothetical protein